MMAAAAGWPELRKPPTACPIQCYCQKNYVIIMTDGQSTYDDFVNSKYSGALFRQPVSDWGDGDNS